MIDTNIYILLDSLKSKIMKDFVKICTRVIRGLDWRGAVEGLSHDDGIFMATLREQYVAAHIEEVVLETFHRQLFFSGQLSRAVHNTAASTLSANDASTHFTF